MRRFAPAFVVTISALAGCGERKPGASRPPLSESNASTEPSSAPETSGPTPNRAEPAPTETDEPDTSNLDAAPRLEDYPILKNPRDAANRAILRAGAGPGCYVELPFGPLKPGEQRPPGSAPPRLNLPCPAPIQDPTYGNCLEGTIHQKRDQSACICFQMDNPPPPPRPIACPAR